MPRIGPWAATPRGCDSAPRSRPPSSTTHRSCCWTSPSTAWTRGSACTPWPSCAAWRRVGARSSSRGAGRDRRVDRGRPPRGAGGRLRRLLACRGGTGPPVAGIPLRGAAHRRIARVGLQLPGARMNGVIARITLRQLLSRRRTLLLVALSAVVILVAALRRISSTGADAKFTADLLSTLGIATLMPLVALIFGTGALGAELEEGTAVYILAKPIARWVVITTKLVVAIACSIGLTSVPILIAGLVAGGGGSAPLGPGLALAGVIG